jgi:hypothetical protein
MIGKGNIRIDFERAILEAEYTKEMDGLDVDFIRSVSASNAFNLKAKDFQSLTYKNEIRFLISKRWFPDLQMSDIFISKVDLNKLNSSLDKMYSLNTLSFMELLDYIPKGMGPGEVLLYFILDNAHLGGGNSAGIDIIDNGTEYEIKAVNRKKDGTLYNFKLGGTVRIAKILDSILNLKDELLNFDKTIKEGETTGINNDHLKGFESKKFLKHIKNINIKGWDDLLKEFQDVAYNGYFKNHPIIFVGSKKANKKETGRIFSILNVKQNQIGMSVTSGTIKPSVNPNL